MMTKIKYLLIIALVTLALPMVAQKLFSLEDLNFGGSNYRNLQPENKWLTWWGDELIRTDVDECYLIDKKTGKETRLFTLDEVNKWANSDEEANRYVRHLMNATFPYPDQPLVALGNKKSFLLLDFKKHEIVWQDSISGQTANDWNKTSRATAYVEDHQLFVVDGEGKKHQLSTDGSREIVYGQSVHRNEFGIEKGTFWSPDGQRLAFYRMDQSMVTDYPQVDIFPREATHEPDKYPMAGMNAHVVTVGVYDLATGKTVYLKTPNGSVTGDFVTDTKPIYFTNIAWSPDAKTIYMFELNRDQNDCRLVSYDATTGERIAELYRETSDKYVEPMNPIQFLPWDSSKFIMQSQRDGYNHLYLYNKDGKLLSQLTSGAWVVQDVLGFNAKQKSIIIEANKYHPLHRQLYSVNVSNGKMTQLTVADGVHHGTLSSSGNYVIDRHSAPTQPRNIRHRQCVRRFCRRESHASAHRRRPLGRLPAAHLRVWHHQGCRRSDRPLLPHGEAPRLRPAEEISHRRLCLWRSSCPQCGGWLALVQPFVGDLHGTEGLHHLHPRQSRLRISRTRLRASHLPPTGTDRNAGPDEGRGISEEPAVC